MRRYRWEICIVLLLLASTVATFWPVLRADFVQWDDDTLLYDNPHLTGLNLLALQWMFTAFDYVVRYQPLTWLIWAAIYEFCGRAPLAYHLANLLFHCCNVALLFLLIRKLLLVVQRGETGSHGRKALLIWAGAGALLWAIHPLRVEAVAWASALLHCQALLFLLISALCYLETAASGISARRRAVYFWASVLSYALSLFSYPIGLGFVLALVVLDVYPLKRFGSGPGRWWNWSARRIWLEKIPYAATAALSVGITVWARLQVSGGWLEAAPLSEFGLAHRAMQACYIWAYYVWKPWVPFNLSPVYTTLLSFRPTDSPFVESALFLALVTMGVVVQRQRWPAAPALWFCYLILMVPVLGLTEHPHYPNDRYSYLAHVIGSIALAAALGQWCRPPRWRALALAVCLAAAVLLGALSIRQTRIWHDSLELLPYTIRKLGNDPYRADLLWRLGKFLASQGKLDEAIAQYRAALRIAPDFAEPHYDLGRALEEQGQIDAAVSHYQTTVRLKPDFVGAHCRLGLILAERGRRQEAKAHLQHALRVDPKQAEARRKLEELLRTK